jgi:recyclin-1
VLSSCESELSHQISSFYQSIRFCEKRPVFYDSATHNPMKNLIKIQNHAGQMVDGVDFSAMESFMNWILQCIQKDGNLIARLFPPESEVLIFFGDRIASEVVSLVSLLGYTCR